MLVRRQDEESGEGKGTVILSGKDLSKVPPKAITGWTVHLDLSDNRIEQLLGALDNAQALVTLDLSYNLLRDLSGLLWLAQLKCLVLDGNSISSLDALGSMSELEILHISGNLLESLEGVQRCKRLKELHAPDNRITHIPNLSDLTMLKNINLSGNGIDYISSMAEAFPEALTTLDLRDNSIPELVNLGSLSRLSNLTTLSVDGNPALAAAVAAGVDPRPFIVYLLPSLTDINGADPRAPPPAYGSSLLRRRSVQKAKVRGSMQQVAASLFKHEETGAMVNALMALQKQGRQPELLLYLAEYCPTGAFPTPKGRSEDGNGNKSARFSLLYGGGSIRLSRSRSPSPVASLRLPSPPVSARSRSPSASRSPSPLSAQPLSNSESPSPGRAWPPPSPATPPVAPADRVKSGRVIGKVAAAAAKFQQLADMAAQNGGSKLPGAVHRGRPGSAASRYNPSSSTTAARPPTHSHGGDVDGNRGAHLSTRSLSPSGSSTGPEADRRRTATSLGRKEAKDKNTKKGGEGAAAGGSNTAGSGESDGGRGTTNSGASSHDVSTNRAPGKSVSANGSGAEKALKSPPSRPVSGSKPKPKAAEMGGGGDKHHAASPVKPKPSATPSKLPKQTTPTNASPALLSGSFAASSVKFYPSRRQFKAATAAAAEAQSPSRARSRSPPASSSVAVAAAAAAAAATVVTISGTGSAGTSGKSRPRSSSSSMRSGSSTCSSNSNSRKRRSSHRRSRRSSSLSLEAGAASEAEVRRLRRQVDHMTKYVNRWIRGEGHRRAASSGVIQAAYRGYRCRAYLWGLALPDQGGGGELDHRRPSRLSDPSATTFWPSSWSGEVSPNKRQDSEGGGGGGRVGGGGVLPPQMEGVRLLESPGQMSEDFRRRLGQGLRRRLWWWSQYRAQRVGPWAWRDVMTRSRTQQQQQQQQQLKGGGGERLEWPSLVAGAAPAGAVTPPPQPQPPKRQPQPPKRQPQPRTEAGHQEETPSQTQAQPQTPQGAAQEKRESKELMAAQAQVGVLVGEVQELQRESSEARVARAEQEASMKRLWETVNRLQKAGGLNMPGESSPPPRPFAKARQAVASRVTAANAKAGANSKADAGSKGATNSKASAGADADEDVPGPPSQARPSFVRAEPSKAATNSKAGAGAGSKKAGDVDEDVPGPPSQDRPSFVRSKFSPKGRGANPRSDPPSESERGSVGSSEEDDLSAIPPPSVFRPSFLEADLVSVVQEAAVIEEDYV